MARASRSSLGLPSTAPSRTTIVSAPRTTASGRFAETALAFRPARSAANSSGGTVPSHGGSRPSGGGATSNASPSRSISSRRRGLPEASTRGGAAAPFTNRHRSSREPQRHRSLVHEPDLHPRAELACLHPAGKLRFAQRAELAVQGLRRRERSGGREIRATALAGVAVERELADDQELTARLSKRAVETAGTVPLEGPQVGDLGGHPGQGFTIVGRGEPDECEETGADPSRLAPLGSPPLGLHADDRHPRLPDALQTDPQIAPLPPAVPVHGHESHGVRRARNFQHG